LQDQDEGLVTTGFPSFLLQPQSNPYMQVQYKKQLVHH